MKKVSCIVMFSEYYPLLFDIMQYMRGGEEGPYTHKLRYGCQKAIIEGG